MSDNHQPETQPKILKALGIILDIDRPGNGSPLRFPAVLRNLVAGVASLEVDNPWNVLRWETLKGLQGNLHLRNGSGEVTDLRGLVTWIRYSQRDRDHGQLSLGLKFAGQEMAVQKLLSPYLSHTPEDIKGLWDLWDQSRQPSSEPAMVSTRTGFVGVTSLFCGLISQTAGIELFKFTGLALWLIGTLGVFGQSRLLWRSIRTSS